MQEIWRLAADGRRPVNTGKGRNSIKGDGYYVSNLGRVKSVIKGVEAMLRQSRDTDGYMKVDFNIGGMRVTKKVHQLVARAFIPNPANKPQVNHKDGNKRNNHVDNLEWVTDSENKLHAFETGLIKRDKTGRFVKSSNRQIDKS